MVCILDKNQDYLVVGDPIGVGRKKWSWVQFEKLWSGIIVIYN
jgi:NAD dependent epimerase/dehydratase family enzyme